MYIFAKKGGRAVGVAVVAVAASAFCVAWVAQLLGQSSEGRGRLAAGVYVVLTARVPHPPYSIDKLMMSE